MERLKSGFFKSLMTSATSDTLKLNMDEARLPLKHQCLRSIVLDGVE